MSETHAQDELNPKALEAAAKAFCKARRYDPLKLEPGDIYGIDGTLPNGDPAHYFWREYVTDAGATVAAYLAALQADPEYLAGWVDLANGGRGRPTTAVLTVYDWAYTDAAGEHYARTPEKAKQLAEQGVKLTPVYTVEKPLNAPPPEYLSGQEAVKVKPLVWHRNTEKAYAASVVGEYRLREIDGTWWRLSLFGAGFELDCADEAEGLAEAQADYQNRILSAIATPDLKAGKAEVTDAMVEAAEAAVYPRHERGFLVKPLIDAIDMRAALEAATRIASLTARVSELQSALSDMLPENCDLGDDPSGQHRPSFAKCERARSLIPKP